MLNLTEIFYSIQGESTYAGLPCIFIRLSGCNLRCNYCDTTYSYETKFSHTKEQIIEIVKQFEPIKLIEITGGEPLLQGEVYELFELLHEKNYKILLETNGSISLENVPEYIIKIIDVKCPGSGEGKSFLLENLEFLNKEKDEIKFVIANENDYLWAKRFVMKHQLKDYEILFSPVTEKLLSEDLAEWITRDKLPVRMQLQLHKLIWDKDKKGV